MPHGVIGRFSECIEWTIPDFCDLFDAHKKNILIESALFSLTGRTWKLLLYPQYYYQDMVVFLRKCYSNIASENVSFFIGIKTGNGIVCEMGGHVSEDSSFSLLHLNELKKRKSELLPHGALTLVCRMVPDGPSPGQIVLNPEKVEDSRRQMLVDLEALSSDLKDLLNDDRKCDVLLKVQGKEFRAHRALLSGRSSVFRSMFEHDTAEAKSGIVIIPDCDPVSFGDFLCFLYTGKPCEVLSFQTACQLYTTADKYDVQRLKSLCAEYMAQNVNASNFCDIALMADQHEELMPATQYFFNKNYHEVFLASEWTSMLRNNFRLADKFMKEMASASSKTTKITKP